MAQPKLTKLELQIMEALWTQRTASIREIQETFPEKDRPAYTTIQTTVYRLEAKKAVRRIKKYQRKMKELILAVRVERELTKAEILSIYLNHVYLGHGAYGVGYGAPAAVGAVTIPATSNSTKCTTKPLASSDWAPSARRPRNWRGHSECGCNITIPYGSARNTRNRSACASLCWRSC